MVEGPRHVLSPSFGQFEQHLSTYFLSNTDLEKMTLPGLDLFHDSGFLTLTAKKKHKKA
jgi:hypothetical protein